MAHLQQKLLKSNKEEKKSTKLLKYLLHSEFTEVLVILSVTLYPEENCIDAQLSRYARTDGAILQLRYIHDTQLSCVETSKPFILITPRTKGNFSSGLVSVNKSEYSELFYNSYIWLE